MTDQTFFRINWNYLPIKAHYFFMFGGCGGSVPFMQVVAKEFGISSMAVGIIFTLVPLCVWISKPAFGFITDKVRNIRNILITLLIVTALTFSAILYIPPIRNREVKSIAVTAVCNELRDELVINVSKYEKDSSCIEEKAKNEYDCELLSHNCLTNMTLSGSLNVTSSLSNNYTGIAAFVFKLHEKSISHQNCDCLERNLSSLLCKLDFYACTIFSTDSLSEYKMYNFWIFVFLTIVSGACSGTLWSLTDAACNEILGDNSNDYGKQRLWGTISWGITTFAAGFFNDLASTNTIHTDYSPGFYLMLAFFTIDLVILCSFRIEKKRKSINICKDVGKIFSSLKTVIFAIGVYISGALSGLIWTYEFWYLTELGSKPLLLGLVAGVQCLVTEVPFFFFSGWFIKKFGHFYCLIAALVAFALRMGLYSTLYNPWWVLPIELLNGVTYAILFAAITLYAVDYAAPGTEATMIGIFGGIFEGLGVATGSFLGGLGFDKKGGRWTFFVASMISLASVPILMILSTFLPRSEGILKLGKERTFPMKEIAKCTSQKRIK